MTKPIDEVNSEFVPEEHEKKSMTLEVGKRTSLTKIVGDGFVPKLDESDKKAAAPPGASDNEKSDTEDEKEKSIHHPLSYVPWGITSFEELAAFEEAREKSFEISEKASLFPDMIANIMSSEEIKDKQKAIRKAGEEFADMVKNIHEDDDEDKKEIDDKKEIGWNEYIETKKLTDDSFIVRIKNKVSDVLKKKVEPLPSNKFMIWKEKDGTYRWFAVYSNNYRDEDLPVPEIISEKSHLAFVEKVHSGDYPYPPLRHYHIPGTDWGQSDFIHYDKETGFAMAGGYVLPGHEHEAELIQQMDDIALSHGMKEVEKDPADPSIIIQHRTFEISDLPRSVAANKLTNFYMVEKEQDMALTDEVRSYLGKAGMSDDQLVVIEEGMDKSQKDAEDQGVERKETDKDADGSDKKKDAGVRAGSEKSDTPAFSEAQSVELKAVFKVLIKNQNEQFLTLLAPIVESIKKLEAVGETEEKRLKTIVELSPPVSLEAFMFPGETLKDQSATLSEDTIIKRGRATKEGKDGPKEASDEENEKIVNTGDAWADDLMNGIIANKPMNEFEGIN